MVTEKIKNKLKQLFAEQITRRNIRLSERDANNRVFPDVKGTEETINTLLEQKCSMSRLGDGEFLLIFGESINYQQYNKQLADKLTEILHSNIPNHIVCISNVFSDLTERNAENKAYWSDFLKVNRHRCYRCIDLNKTYYNTSATRVYKLLDDKSLAAPRFEQWKRLWKDKDIVFIEGTQTRMGVGNTLFSNAKSIRRIIGPSENAFSKSKDVLEAALRVDGDPLFLLALGPAATVISYELAKHGKYALDIGHIDIEYEWFLRENADVAIEGKYTNEVFGGNKVAECTNEEYLKEIIWKYDE